ncbi:MAG: type 4a pilus biogenesis protein PilO [Nitrospirota bacterium]
MAESQTKAPLIKRKLSKREWIIVLITAFIVGSALLYQFPYTYLVKKVKELQQSVQATERDILSLSVQLADIKAREAEIKAGTKRGITGWKLGDQKSAMLFLDGISSEARREGVSLLAVHPSQESDKDKYKEVSMNLDLKGRYRELAEYFKRLENMPQIVNIRKIRVEACPDASSACATQLEAVTYMAK